MGRKGESGNCKNEVQRLAPDLIIVIVWVTGIALMRFQTQLINFTGSQGGVKIN